MEYILVHDLGTSGNKATLFGTNGDIIQSTIFDYPTFKPESDFFEQNPNDFWEAVVNTTKQIANDIDVTKIIAISFSGHMHGMIPMSKDGKNLYNSIIWTDGRAKQETQCLVEKLSVERIYEITGHRPFPMYSIEKAMWIKNQRPDVYNRTYKILNNKDFVIYKMTGEFVTDHSDASGTNAYDITKRCWSSEILQAAEIPIELMPKILDSTEVVGPLTEQAALQLSLPAGIPIVCGGGDGACANVGAASIENGNTYCCMGSSAWIGSTDDKPATGSDMRLMTFAHLIPNKYMICGTMSACGLSYNYILDKLNIKPKPDKDIHQVAEDMLKSSEIGANGVLYVPYLNGERCLYWDRKAKGAFLGLTATDSDSDILRAVIEGVSLQLSAILDVFRQMFDVKDMNLIGGSVNRTWIGIMASALDVDIYSVSNSRYATSIGAAVAAGVGVKVFEDFSAVKLFLKREDKFFKREYDTNFYNQRKELLIESYEALKILNHKL